MTLALGDFAPRWPLRRAAVSAVPPPRRARSAPGAAPGRRRGDGHRVLRPDRHPVSVRRRARAPAAAADRRRHRVGDGAPGRAPVARPPVPRRLRGRQPRGAGADAACRSRRRLLAKCLAHWLVTGLPLTVMAPLLALLLHLGAAGLSGAGARHGARHAEPQPHRRGRRGADAGRAARRRAAVAPGAAALHPGADLRRRRVRGGWRGLCGAARICCCSRRSWCWRWRWRRSPPRRDCARRSNNPAICARKIA